MPSINFNQSAQVALMNLSKVNENLFKIQDQISTGKRIANAKDSASVWAISTVMNSDVMGFQQITNSLNLGTSTVEVARAASEQVSNLLTQIKAEIVSAKEQNVDRTAIQRDIVALKDQISSIVDAAQFNGLNLLKGGADIEVLSSFNRDSTGNVTTAEISVARADLRQVEGVFGTTQITAGAGLNTASSASIAAGATETLTLTAGTINAGYSFEATIASTTVQYIASEGDTVNDVAQALVDEFGVQFAALEATTPGSSPDVDFTLTVGTDPLTQNAVINITNNEATAVALAGDSFNDGVAGGDLGRLFSIDVDTTVDADIDQALLDVEDMIQSAIDATAAFGSVQNRIDIQSTFIDSLVSSLQSGISSLTDANLEEASARLQALQVQQQLNIQALAIANQAPQALLALFQ
ncbi:flagellin [Parvularcula lutaonensis]|uniref:Flagellin n=1 Tax=Parvularcula lutaonensis TaxID=491923 RepID=A0ABV7M8G7_9PROT|nr:flagellin [Parvularcula lutaonensis]GGY43887.1 flagellin [Parvularcula lutaonensis]